MSAAVRQGAPLRLPSAALAEAAVWSASPLTKELLVRIQSNIDKHTAGLMAEERIASKELGALGLRARAYLEGMLNGLAASQSFILSCAAGNVAPETEEDMRHRSILEHPDRSVLMEQEIVIHERVGALRADIEKLYQFAADTAAKRQAIERGGG